VTEVLRPVVVPDLDRELVDALEVVEEVLLSLRRAEGDPAEAVGLPPALAGGAALGALRRVADAVRPTQTDPDTDRGPRVLGPDGRYEHVPLRFLQLWAADVGALAAAAEALGDPARGEEVTAALEQAEGPAAAAAAVALAARLSGLLGLAWTGDAELLRARLAGVAGDAVLTGEEEDAYQRTATRCNDVWASGSGVDRFVY